MILERKSLPFDLKGTSEDGSTFEGIAAAFHNIDSYGDIITPGAFADGLAEFLQNGFVGGLNHNWDSPIGKPLSAEEQTKGLYVKARISDTPHGNECKTLIKDTVVKKLSIGFRTVAREWLDTCEDVMNYWTGAGYVPTPADMAESVYGARLLTKIKLYEFSPVTIPANGLCDITDSSNLKGESPVVRTFEAHSEQTLDAVEEWLTRVSSLYDLRKQDGRSLSRLHQKDLSRLETVLRKAEQMVKATQKETASPAQLRKDLLSEVAAYETLLNASECISLST